jgi:hypothetical protein
MLNWKLVLEESIIIIKMIVLKFYILKFNFYINFDFDFYDCYIFLIEIFYPLNLILILLIVAYFI